MSFLLLDCRALLCSAICIFSGAFEIFFLAAAHEMCCAYGSAQLAGLGSTCCSQSRSQPVVLLGMILLLQLARRDGKGKPANLHREVAV